MNPKDPDIQRLASAVRRLQVADKRHRSKPRSAAEMRTLIAVAEDRATQARHVREHYARQSDPRNGRRIEDIDKALAALHEIAVPLKQEGGRLPRDARREWRWGEQLRAASAAVQRERRKLWKMRKRAG